jgi:hypothetical protein
MFFFEKKNQKTFITWFRVAGSSEPNKQKFFASFFQKRSLSLTSYLLSALFNEGTRSVRSHVNVPASASGERPKWPYAVVGT